MTQDRYDENATEWNQAQAYMQRMDNLLKLANNSSLIDDYDNWYDAIEALYRELAPRMTSEEARDARKLIFIARNFVKINPNNRQKLGLAIWKFRDSLSDAEVYLRRIMKIRGMDLPAREDPGSSLLSDKGF